MRELNIATLLIPFSYLGGAVGVDKDGNHGDPKVGCALGSKIVFFLEDATWVDRMLYMLYSPLTRSSVCSMFAVSNPKNRRVESDSENNDHNLGGYNQI